MDNNLNNNQPMNEEELSDILRIRREKLAALREAGNDPFVITKYDVTDNSLAIKNDFDNFENKEVSLAGRIMSRRIMGKASFAGISDSTGNIQIYIKRDDVGEEDYAAFKKWDIGDIIGVKGERRPAFPGPEGCPGRPRFY